MRTGPIRIFISGPYSSDPVGGARQAVAAADALADDGFVPFVPHLTLLWDAISEVRHAREFWLAQDMHWLRLCHAVLRLPGESAGADAEVAEAVKLNMPVFTSSASVRTWAKGGRR